MAKKKIKNVEKYGRKKKYGSFFLKVFVPMIIVVALLGCAFSSAMNMLFETTRSENVTAVRDGIADAVEKCRLYQETEEKVIYDFQKSDNYVSGSLNLACAMNGNLLSEYDGGSIIRMYRRNDDGSLTALVTNNNKIFVIVQDENNNRYRLMCNVDDYKKALEAAPVYEEAGELPYIESIDEIYVKGDNFYVGAYTYIDYGPDATFNDEGFIVSNSNNAPVRVTVSDIPEGYVKLDESKGFTLTFSTPIGIVDTKMDDPCEDVEERIDMVTQDFELEEQYDKCEHGNHVTIVEQYADGYIAVIEYHYSFFDSAFGKLLIGTLVGIIVLTIIVSLIISFLMWKSYINVWNQEQYRRTMSNAMAHDLKSPLSVIALYAENLKAKTNPEKTDYYIDGIIEEVNLMNRQIASILDMSKAEDINTKLSLSTFEVSPIVNKIIANHQEKIASKNVVVDVTGDCSITADKVFFEQAVSNLIDNAVKFVTDGGVISVNLEPDKLTFANTCPTLDESLLATIWNPFVKGDGSRQGHEGTGLGLSIVKTIMDRHGFTCKMENTEDGVQIIITM